jgi:hypothetical protein
MNDWYNRIDRNYLKNVPYPGGEVNGREGIQLGQLKELKNGLDDHIIGRSIVENNLLENVDYDPEVISVKTNENLIRFNTIRGSKNGGLVAMTTWWKEISSTTHPLEFGSMVQTRRYLITTLRGQEEEFGLTMNRQTRPLRIIQLSIQPKLEFDRM